MSNGIFCIRVIHQMFIDLYPDWFMAYDKFKPEPFNTCFWNAFIGILILRRSKLHNYAHNTGF